MGGLVNLTLLVFVNPHLNFPYFSGSLVVSPRSGIMLGGDNIFIAGPCYTPSDSIICEFPGGKISNGSYISNIRASCTVPMLNITGKLSIKMSVNGGKSFDFQGSFTTGKY